MMNRDLQSKLERVRPPRVHITYDVETAGAIESRELPFVIGVLSSVSGRLDELLPPLKSRNFIDIDFDNFNHVLAAFRPRLAYRVENLLTDDGGTLAGELRFSEISDFEPRQIIRQVKPLEDLLQTRATFQTKEELANLDALLSRQLNLIMHDPAFQELEASWRGLHYLVSKSETGVMVRIRVLNVSKKELLKDLE